MKNIRILPTRQEALEYFWSEVITQTEFRENPFYQKLVEFVVDHRALAFFEASEPEIEHAHFTQWFGLFLRRDTYDSPYLRDLYFIHDLIHSLFYYPLQPRHMTREQYAVLVRLHERVASNESEVLSYYRVPSLREKTFPYPIFYDWLQQHLSTQPAVGELLALRETVTVNDPLRSVMMPGDEWRAVRAFFERFHSDDRWSTQWYEAFPELSKNWFAQRRFLTTYDYESELLNYEPDLSGKIYQQSLEANLRLWEELSAVDGESIRLTAKNVSKRLNNTVLLRNTAQAFAPTYTQRKKKMNQQITAQP